MAEDGKNNLKSILSPVHITLEFLTWDKQTFEFKPIQKLLTSKYQNVLKELQCEWPKRAKEYITKLDERLNQPSTNENASISIDADSSLAPDLQRRLLLSQNSQKNDNLTIQEEIEFYENELGSRFLACMYRSNLYELYYIAYMIWYLLIII